MKKTRILIAGIGGVGGYFGGLLAHHFYKHDEVEIIFLARGKHLEVIKANGLKVVKGSNELVAAPEQATDNPTEIGTVDYIILCTKSYDLESTVKSLNACIDKDTIILPLLNGVDSRERVKNILPNNLVLDGCVYIISRLAEAGKIENMGNIETLYFGLDNFENEKMRLLEKLFKEANINATLSSNISSIIWEKFIFISPVATATSYFNSSIGQIVADEEKLQIISLLIKEVKQIADKKGINIPADIFEKTLHKLKSMPFEATSSMQRDFQAKKQTELSSLTAYVVNEGKKNNIPTPIFEKLLNELKEF